MVLRPLLCSFNQNKVLTFLINEKYLKICANRKENNSTVRRNNAKIF